VDCAFAVTPVRECRHDVVDPAEKRDEVPLGRGRRKGGTPKLPFRRPRVSRAIPSGAEHPYSRISLTYDHLQCFELLTSPVVSNL